jgi:membrane fusion protein
VAGYLAPQLGVVRIVPRHAGTILAVHVHEGDLVRPGDSLLTIGAGEANEFGQDVDAAMLNDLQRQAASVQEQIDAEQQSAQRKRAAADDAISSQAQVIASLRAELSLQGQRAGIAQRDLQASADLLARADMSPLEARRRQDAFLAQRQAETSLARTLLDKLAELARLRSEAADIVPASAQRLAVLRGEAASIDGRLVERDGQRAYQIQSPVRGRISALQAWVGRAADPAMKLMSIVPEGGALQAQLLVPARAIGFVRSGQKVRLSYDTFPYQQYGFAQGVVATVARTSLKPGEVEGPLDPEAPTFRVTVTLASQTIGASGAIIALQPDTRLQADILLEKRSLLAWLADPLHVAGDRL